MTFTDAALCKATDGILATYKYVSLHTADPGSTGTSESAASSGGRQLPTWPAATGSGDSNVTNIAFTGGTGSGACTHCGLWSAATGGTFGGGFALTGDQVFNAAGAYTITSLTVNATAT